MFKQWIKDQGITLFWFSQNLIPFKIYVTWFAKKWVVRITAIIIHVYTYICCMQIVIHPRLRTHLQNSSSVSSCQSDSIHTNKQMIFFKTRKRSLRLLLILTVRYWEIMLLIPNKSWSILFGAGIKTTMKKSSFDFSVNTIVTNSDQFWIQRSLKADFK